MLSLAPSPSPTPGPIQVQVINEPGFWEIFSQVVLPTLAIIISVAALWYTHHANKERDAKEVRARVQVERSEYATRLREFLLGTRTWLGRSVNESADEWRQLVAGAPDSGANELLTWAINERNDLQQAHRDAPGHPDDTQHHIDLDGEIDVRVRHWLSDGTAVTTPSIGRQNWPKKPE